MAEAVQVPQVESMMKLWALSVPPALFPGSGSQQQALTSPHFELFLEMIVVKQVKPPPVL